MHIIQNTIFICVIIFLVVILCLRLTSFSGQKNLRLHVIAFDVGTDAKAKKHLKRIADAAGGNFHTADALADLITTVEKAALGYSAVSGGGGKWDYHQDLYTQKKCSSWKIVLIAILAICDVLLIFLIARKKGRIHKSKLS